MRGGRVGSAFPRELINFSLLPDKNTESRNTTEGREKEERESN